jgi:hypothetical protein
MKYRERSRTRHALPLIVTLAVGCAGADEIQQGDATTADLSAAPVDDGPGDAPALPPDGAPPLRPPQEAFDACLGLAAGAACSVSNGDRAVGGACRQGPREEHALACVPTDFAPPGPPPEVFAACEGLAADAACSLAIGGTCRQGPDGEGLLACVPANLPPPPPRHGHLGPPRVAVTACEGLAADAACSFELDGHALEGACRNGPDGRAPLACAPANLPPPPHMPPREAFDACTGLAADASCSFELDGHGIDGVCWAPPDRAGAPLACAPPEIRVAFAAPPQP